jgi:hypothetical protein
MKALMLGIGTGGMTFLLTVAAPPLGFSDKLVCRCTCQAGTEKVPMEFDAPNGNPRNCGLLNGVRCEVKRLLLLGTLQNCTAHGVLMKTGSLNPQPGQPTSSDVAPPVIWKY